MFMSLLKLPHMDTESVMDDPACGREKCHSDGGRVFPYDDTS